MDKDRVEGAAKQAKGKLKETVGKVTGDAKTEAEGKADKTEGKVQNTVGGIKDKDTRSTRRQVIAFKLSRPDERPDRDSLCMQAVFHQSNGGADRAGIANHQKDEVAKIYTAWLRVKSRRKGSPQSLPKGTPQRTPIGLAT